MSEFASPLSVLLQRMSALTGRNAAYLRCTKVGFGPVVTSGEATIKQMQNQIPHWPETLRYLRSTRFWPMLCYACTANSSERSTVMRTSAQPHCNMQAGSGGILSGLPGGNISETMGPLIEQPLIQNLVGGCDLGYPIHAGYTVNEIIGEVFVEVEQVTDTDLLLQDLNRFSVAPFTQERGVGEYPHGVASPITEQPMLGAGEVSSDGFPNKGADE